MARLRFQHLSFILRCDFLSWGLVANFVMPNKQSPDLTRFKLGELFSDVRFNQQDRQGQKIAYTYQI